MAFSGQTNILGDYSGAGTLTQGPLKTGVVIMEGDVNPGSSPAAITIETNLAFGPSASLNIELGGLTPGQGPIGDENNGYDQLNVLANSTLDGTLDIQFIDGFESQIIPADQFVIMTWGTNTELTTFNSVTFTPRADIDGLSFDSPTTPTT